MFTLSRSSARIRTVAVGQRSVLDIVFISRLHRVRCRNMSRTVSISVPGGNKSISLQTGLFINNEFVPSVDGLEIEYDELHISFTSCFELIAIVQIH